MHMFVFFLKTHQMRGRLNKYLKTNKQTNKQMSGNKNIDNRRTASKRVAEGENPRDHKKRRLTTGMFFFYAL